MAQQPKTDWRLLTMTVVAVLSPIVAVTYSRGEQDSTIRNNTEDICEVRAECRTIRKKLEDDLKAISFQLSEHNAELRELKAKQNLIIDMLKEITK